MVSHKKKSKAGGRQNPNAARKTPQRPEPQRQPKRVRDKCVSCRSSGARCDGGKPCSHCEKRLKSDCVYEDPDTCYPTIYRVKKKDEPQQPNEPRELGNGDTNQAIGRASASSTTHKAGELDDQGLTKQLDKLREAHFLRSRVSSMSPSKNAPLPPAVGHVWASANPIVQPSGASVPACLRPPLIPRFHLQGQRLQINAPPPMSNAPQPESSLEKGKQSCSLPSPIERGEEHKPNVPDYACQLIDKDTGSLKHHHKVAVVEMLRRLRSALDDAKQADKEAHKPIMPPYELGLYLLRVYHKEISYLFPFICFSTFMRAYRGINGDDGIAAGFSPSASFGLGGSGEGASTHPIMFRCALFTMLSHASKFTDMKDKDKTFLSRAFWECAVAHLTPALVKENSLAAVQTFLVVAVAFNSTRFSGDERKIPIEIAYRLAQHMRLDVKDDEVMRSPEEQQVRMKTWYGCVMMTSFVQSGDNFDFPLAAGVDTEVLVSADQLPPGSVPFSFFTGCVAHLEALEKLVLRMPRIPCPVLSQGDIIRQQHNLAELVEMLAKFVAVLPASLDWTTMGIPVLEIDAVKSVDAQDAESEAAEAQTDELQTCDSIISGVETEASQDAVCNTIYLLIRSLLFCPIFMEAGIQESLASGEDMTTLNHTGEQKARFCAFQCLKNSILLINYMRRRSTSENKVRSVWWWDPLQVGIAGIVIIMAQTSEPLWNAFDQTLLQQTWKFCQELLIFDKFNSSYKREVIAFLWNVNHGITQGRTLNNEYTLMPQPPSMTEKGGGSLRSWTFDIDPAKLEPDSIRIVYRVPKRPNGGLPKKYDMGMIGPRTKVEDAFIPPQASADSIHPEVAAGAKMGAEMAAMAVPNAFDDGTSLTPSLVTDFADISIADLDFTFTQSMMDEMDFSMDVTPDPDLDADAAQLISSSEMPSEMPSDMPSDMPLSPLGWHMGEAHHGPASISASTSLMPFPPQPAASTSNMLCYQPAPLTASMAYSQPAPGPGVSELGASPLRVMHFNPNLPTDQGRSSFSITPSQSSASVDLHVAAAAAFHGGHIFLSGLRY